MGSELFAELKHFSSFFFQVTPEFADLKSESGTVVNYLQGIVQQVNCFQNGDDGTAGIQVTHFTVFLEIKLVWGTVATGLDWAISIWEALPGLKKS